MLRIISIRTESRTVPNRGRKNRTPETLKHPRLLLPDTLQQDRSTKELAVEVSLTASSFRDFAAKRSVIARSLKKLMVSGNSIARSLGILTYLAFLCDFLLPFRHLFSVFLTFSAFAFRLQPRDPPKRGRGEGGGRGC